MIEINGHRIKDLVNLGFCYLCGEPIEENDVADRDHVPPKTCFAISDRVRPLILRTHKICNNDQSPVDERFGQLFAGLIGRKIKHENQRVNLVPIHVFGSTRQAIAVTDIELDLAVMRWIRGFHAALYRAPLLKNVTHTIQTPFPLMIQTDKDWSVRPLRPQHAMFVETIKRNRVARNLDRISAYNGKVTYECVWTHTNDNGPWMCIFALDVQNWKRLGDIHHFPARGCAGAYVMPNGAKPDNASSDMAVAIRLPNFDKLDPFAA